MRITEYLVLATVTMDMIYRDFPRPMVGHQRERSPMMDQGCYGWMRP